MFNLFEELATSGWFYAREELITTRILLEKLEKEVRFDQDLDLRWYGNDGRDDIHISPLSTSMIP